MTRDLLAEIDERAKSLGINRSQYLALVARRDLAERGGLLLEEKESPKELRQVAGKPVGDRVLTKYPPLKRK